MLQINFVLPLFLVISRHAVTQPCYCPIVSSSSSASSQDIPGVDTTSLSSYRNAIEKHRISLPEISDVRQRVAYDSLSSSSSQSYYDDM